jgi:phage gp46-like protein
MSRFQGDIAIKITKDGAKMKFVDGEPVRDRGIENATQISLFTKKKYWGNALVKKESQKIGSDFEKQRVVIFVETLNEVRNDANLALQWMLDTNLASKIDLTVMNPALDYIETYIKIYPPGQDIQELLFLHNGVNWINQAIDPAHRKMEDVI